MVHQTKNPTNESNQNPQTLNDVQRVTSGRTEVETKANNATTQDYPLDHALKSLGVLPAQR